MHENQTRLGRWAVGPALLLALSGCGDDATTPHDAREPTSPSSAGAAGETSDDIETPHQLDIEIDVAGSEEPITGSVSEHGGLIRISSFPKQLAFPISYTLLPLAFDGAFSDDFCQSVRELTELEPEASAVDLVRHRGAPVARIPLSSLVWPETMTQARQSAQALGVTQGISFANPLTIDTIEIALELSKDALSHTLGTEDLSSLFEDALAKEGEIALQTGVLSLSFGAQDLWCDLANGDATIRIQVVGSFGDEPYEGETLVSGVEEL